MKKSILISIYPLLPKFFVKVVPQCLIWVDSRHFLYFELSHSAYIVSKCNPLATDELKPDENHGLVKEVIETESMGELLDNNYGIMPINGPGLSRKVVELLSQAEGKLESGSPQAVELAEYIGERERLDKLIRTVPSMNTINLYDRLLTKCPENQRERLAEEFPKMSAEDTAFGDHTLYT